MRPGRPVKQPFTIYRPRVVIIDMCETSHPVGCGWKLSSGLSCYFGYWRISPKGSAGIERRVAVCTNTITDLDKLEELPDPAAGYADSLENRSGRWSCHPDYDWKGYGWEHRAGGSHHAV
jgi:hypothetical protein